MAVTKAQEQPEATPLGTLELNAPLESLIAVFNHQACILLLKSETGASGQAMAMGEKAIGY